jgi:hypothetical protein
MAALRPIRSAFSGRGRMADFPFKTSGPSQRDEFHHRLTVSRISGSTGYREANQCCA